MRRRAVAGVCVAVILLAAILPALCSLDGALIELQWVLFPDEVVVADETPILPCDEQPIPLLSHAFPRPPPADV